uniref:Uncharacterized protein n=1 Tax=Anguilla anguilla TaxID=7936 RepID=A0A0E9Q9L2_ANGAN
MSKDTYSQIRES